VPGAAVPPGMAPRYRVNASICVDLLPTRRSRAPRRAVCVGIGWGAGATSSCMEPFSLSCEKYSALPRMSATMKVVMVPVAPWRSNSSVTNVPASPRMSARSLSRERPWLGEPSIDLITSLTRTEPSRSAEPPLMMLRT
jgi:hypothetical protein